MAGKVDPNGIKVRLGDEASALLALKATRLRMSTGEYLRNLVMVHLYGVDELTKLHRQRLEVVSQVGPDAGPEPALTRP